MSCLVGGHSFPGPGFPDLVYLCATSPPIYAVSGRPESAIRSNFTEA